MNWQDIARAYEVTYVGRPKVDVLEELVSFLPVAVARTPRPEGDAPAYPPAKSGPGPGAVVLRRRAREAAAARGE